MCTSARQSAIRLSPLGGADCRRRCGRLRQRGLTLVELVVFIVIISVALTGVLLTFNTVVRSSADPLVSRQLQAIAEAMLEEVLLQDFADPDGTGREASREFYDNVDDYQDFGVGVTGITYPRGDKVPHLDDYSVAVKVVDIPDWNGANAKRVTVTASRAGQSFVLSGYRTEDPSP